MLIYRIHLKFKKKTPKTPENTSMKCIVFEVKINLDKFLKIYVKDRKEV